MKALSAAGGLVGARSRGRGKVAVGVTAAFAGVRVYKRLIRRSTKPVMRFTVKPGETYEIKGVRRGQ